LEKSGESVEELLYLPNRVQHVVCGGGASGGLRVVGAVVAQIDGDHVISVQAQRFEQVEYRLALVPTQLGLDLKDHLARCDLERLWMFASLASQWLA
jgi:hypothetical protein